MEFSWQGQCSPSPVHVGLGLGLGLGRGPVFIMPPNLLLTEIRPDCIPFFNKLIDQTLDKSVLFIEFLFEVYRLKFIRF